MSSHHRAARISTESTALAAASNEAETFENRRFLSGAVEAYIDSNPPTTQDVLKQLESKHLGHGLETVAERKKALVENVLDPFLSPTGKNFISIVKSWNVDVGEQLEKSLPTKQAVKHTTYSNSILAKCLLNIYESMLCVDKAIKDPSKSIVLRTTAANEFWMKVFDNSVACWIGIAKTLAKSNMAKKAAELFHPLDAVQARRRYLERGYHPNDDPKQRTCICCEHLYTDFSNDTKDLHLKNKEIFDKHEQEVAQWQAKKNRGKSNVGNKPRNPKQLFRVKYCHCHQFHCGGNPLVGTTQCPMNCIDPRTKERFPVKDGICQCPICMCNCSVAIKVSLWSE